MGTITVRNAGVADVAGIAEIHVRSWRAAYRGLLADALLDALSVTERELHWQTILSEDGGVRLTVVAEEAGDLVGFCSAVALNADRELRVRTAEIGALYVDPRNWRRGVGTALLTGTFRGLRERGCRDAVLWVLPENRTALAFYGRLGFAIEKGIEKVEERSGRSVIRLRLGTLETGLRQIGGRSRSP